MFEWLRKAPWGHPAFAGMFLSLVFFGFIGGISGVVLGTEQLNVLMHNTIYVPGHFHGTVVAGTTLAFMGATYLVLPLVFEREILFPKLAKLQPYLFGIGAAGISLFMMGAGTLGLELEDQVGVPDAVLAAVGGGGLIGGIAAWFGGRTRVIGVEPELAPTLARALAAGEPVDAPCGGIAADSLAPRRIGTRAFAIARRFVDSVLVTDDAIAHAQRTLWSGLRIAAEPGGAASTAALLSGRFQLPPGARVAIVVSGGNTSAVQLP